MVESVLLTHSSRSYEQVADRSHISWYTLSLMCNAVESAVTSMSHDTPVRVLTQGLDHVDSDSVNKSLLIVFLIGQPSQHAIDVMNNCEQLWVVAEDPNWDCSLNGLARNYKLITWSAALATRDTAGAAEFIDKNVPRWSITERMTSHLPLSLIDLIFMHDDRAPSAADSVIRTTAELLSSSRDALDEVSPRTVYVGSLKKDRIASLVDAALSNPPLTLYGNFDAEDFKAVAVECGIDQSRADAAAARAEFKGRIPFNTVMAVQSRYKFVLYCPDQAIESLALDTLRKLELAVSAAVGCSVKLLLANSSLTDSASLTAMSDVSRITSIADGAQIDITESTDELSAIILKLRTIAKLIVSPALADTQGRLIEALSTVMKRDQLVMTPQ